MAERHKVTAEGLQITQIPDGASVMPPTVGTTDGADATEESPEQVSTDALLADLLGDNNAENVEPVQVLVGEHLLDFGVRTLSVRESSALLRKRLRNAGGKLTPLQDADVILQVQALVQCVRKNAGTPETPEWVPQWTEEEVAGTPQKRGLIDNASDNARALIGDTTTGLLGEIWARNKAINPVFLDATDRGIAEVAKLLLDA